MNGLTDYITSGRWEEIFTIWYVSVDDAYQALERQYGAWRRAGPEPTFSDSEVITIALICDTFFHGHEELSLLRTQFLAASLPQLAGAEPPQSASSPVGYDYRTDPPISASRADL